MSTLSHLECSRANCDTELNYSSAQHLCPRCQSPLLARYDLDVASRTLNLAALKDRPNSMWRFAEVLPGIAADAGFATGAAAAPLSVAKKFEPISLGEGKTPLLRAARYGERLGLANLFVKDEGLNPTGSFKARGLSAAVSMAKTLGVEILALPTAGNAGGAAAAYAAQAGLHCVIAMPADTPMANVIESKAFGADVRMIDGLISDCGKFIAENVATEGWYDVSTLKEPYRIEGKKTMGYELWEEFDGRLPKVIVYPTGGGVGLIGMWKAFEELETMGLIGAERPRMIAVQAEGCAPIVRAFAEQAEASEFWDAAATVASGLRVPKALGDFIVLADIYASRGEAIAASDAELMQACSDLARLEGVFAAPEGGAGLVAVAKLVSLGKIEPDESVVVFNTGSGYKYLEAWQAALE